MKIVEPNKIFLKVKNKFTKNDILIFFIVFVLGIITNFTFITTKGISPDALSMNNFYWAGEWEISLGRFGIKFIDMLRAGLVNKFLIILMCLLYLALSIMLITRTFKIKSKVSIFILSMIIAVAPQFTETYLFIYCADSYCFAFLMANLAVFFLSKSKGKKIYNILSIVCTIITCSIYQAYLGVILGLIILLIISKILNNEKISSIVKDGLKYIFIVAVGVILYYIILKIIIAIMGISLSAYKGANNLGIENIKQLPYTILRTYIDFHNFFFNDKIINNKYYNRFYLYLILIIITIIGIIRNLASKKYSCKIVRVEFLICCIVVFPICVNIMDIIAPMTITNLLTGIGILTSIVIIPIVNKGLDNKSLSNIIKWIYIVLTVILTITFIIENTFTYMCRQETYENYYAVINNVYNRATQLEGYTKDKKWLFSYTIEYSPNDLEKANSENNETWGNFAGMKQNKNFFEKYLGIQIETCSMEEYNSIILTEEFKNMPIYPEDGSIKIINNIIVVKTSNKIITRY